MPDADGYVRIKTEFDDSNLTRKLQGLGSKLNKELASLEKARSHADALRASLEKISSGEIKPKSIESLERDIARTEKDADRLNKQLDTLTSERQALRDKNVGGIHDAEINDLNERIEELSAKFVETVNAADEMRAKLEELRMNPENTAEAQELAEKLRLAESETERLAIEANTTREQMDALRNSASNLAPEVEKSESAFSRLGGYVKRLARRMLLLYAFRRVFTFIRNGIMGMTGLSVVTGELNNFISKMKEAYSSNTQIQAALAGLRGALYTAFSPIYSAVVPALVSFINWLARAISYISAFMSALGGGSFAKSAAGADKLAKSIGGVGGAAKEANKQLASFDKLNTLSENKGGGGGGGGGASKIEAPDVDEDKIARWEAVGQRIREIILGIKNRIKEFVDWFNDADPGAKLIALGLVLGTLIPLLFTLLPWPLAMVAALTVLFTLVEKYYGQIVAWLDGAYEKISSFFANATAQINSHISAVQAWLNNHFNFIGHIFSAILEVIRTVLTTAYMVVSTVVLTIINVLKAVVETIHAIATGDWSKAWEAWGRVFADVWNGIKQIGINVANGIIGVFENMVNGLISIINGLLSWVNAIGGFFGATFELGLSKVSLPRFASGGFPDVGSMFIAGEAGPELVGSFGSHNNSVINEAQLVQAFEQASSEQVALLQQQNSLLAAILNKELTFKPSSSAGRAFQQSINMYNRALG